MYHTMYRTIYRKIPQAQTVIDLHLALVVQTFHTFLCHQRYHLPFSVSVVAKHSKFKQPINIPFCWIVLHRKMPLHVRNGYFTDFNRPHSHVVCKVYSFDVSPSSPDSFKFSGFLFYSIISIDKQILEAFIGFFFFLRTILDLYDT